MYNKQKSTFFMSYVHLFELGMNDSGPNIQRNRSKNYSEKSEFICSNIFYTRIDYFKHLPTS